MYGWISKHFQSKKIKLISHFTKFQSIKKNFFEIIYVSFIFGIIYAIWQWSYCWCHLKMASVEYKKKKLMLSINKSKSFWSVTQVSFGVRWKMENQSNSFVIFCIFLSTKGKLYRKLIKNYMLFMMTRP